MGRAALLSNVGVGSYIDRGFVNFKIVGRGMPMEFAKESYLYYLVKEEHRDFIRAKIDSLFAQIRNVQRR